MNKNNPCRDFLKTARTQFKRSCIPAVTAVAVSSLIAATGTGAVVVVGMTAVGVAYWQGWRVRIVKPETVKKPKAKSKAKV